MRRRVDIGGSGPSNLEREAAAERHSDRRFMREYDANMMQGGGSCSREPRLRTCQSHPTASFHRIIDKSRQGQGHRIFGEQV
jgi:hypothetical protein